MIPVIGTSCGLLAAAAFAGGMRPAVTLPEAGDAGLTVAEDTAPASTRTSTSTAGPLQIPSIGVVAPGFDQKYASLSAAAHSSPVPSPSPAAPGDVASQLAVSSSDRRSPSATAEGPTAAAVPEPTTPTTPTSGTPSAAPSSTPRTPPPSSATPSADPTASQPPSSSAPASSASGSTASDSTSPSSAAPTSPTATPPSTTPPSTTPPSTTPPSTTPPTTTPPSTSPPPTQAPPTDVTLAVGQHYDVLDPSGGTAYTIVVNRVVADVPCTAPAKVPPEHGHLVGVKLKVITGADPAGKPQSFAPTDFQFVGADGTPVTDVATKSAATCLKAADEFPTAPVGADQKVTGTVVLDVPATTGTLAYRPASGLTSLLWRF